MQRKKVSLIFNYHRSLVLPLTAAQFISEVPTVVVVVTHVWQRDTVPIRAFKLI